MCRIIAKQDATNVQIKEVTIKKSYTCILFMSQFANNILFQSCSKTYTSTCIHFSRLKSYGLVPQNSTDIKKNEKANIHNLTDNMISYHNQNKINQKHNRM